MFSTWAAKRMGFTENIEKSREVAFGTVFAKVEDTGKTGAD